MITPQMPNSKQMAKEVGMICLADIDPDKPLTRLQAALPAAPVRICNTTPAEGETVPLPGEENVTVPGFALPSRPPAASWP